MPQKAAAQHGRKSQRDDAGNKHSHSDRDRKLTQQSADNAAQETAPE